jgi:hypothetical protein
MRLNELWPPLAAEAALWLLWAGSTARGDPTRTRPAICCICGNCFDADKWEMLHDDDDRICSHCYEHGLADEEDGL